MTEEQRGPAQAVDALSLYPGQTKQVMADHIGPYTVPRYIISLVETCVGEGSPVQSQIIPPAEGKLITKILFTFDSTAQADRVLAIMNDHPALDEDFVSFSRPDFCYPEIRTLFTKRVVEAFQRSEQRYICPREPWMSDIDWPDGCPSPSQVYDELVQHGPIHNLRVLIADEDEVAMDGLWWDVVVQYFAPEYAESLDRREPKELLGYKVDIHKTKADLSAARLIQEIDDWRAKRSLPPARSLPPLPSPEAIDAMLSRSSGLDLDSAGESKSLDITADNATAKPTPEGVSHPSKPEVSDSALASKGIDSALEPKGPDLSLKGGVPKPKPAMPDNPPKPRSFILHPMRSFKNRRATKSPGEEGQKGKPAVTRDK